MTDVGLRPESASGDVPAALADAIHERLVAARAPGAPLLVALDVDGTLAPIVQRPEDAAVPAETRRVLVALDSRPGVVVAVVSGRAAAAATAVVGLPGLWVIGNHGAETVAPDGTLTVDPLVAPFRSTIASAAESLAAPTRAVAGARLENKTWTLTIHYRRVADAAGVATLEAAITKAGREFGLTLHRGKQVFELRPPVLVNKGTALLRLAHDLRADAPGAALLYSGDDVTDEDAFRALRSELPAAVTIRVAGEEPGADGSGEPVESSAEFVVVGLPALRVVLERLDAWLAST